uniref:Uncharacterized protein n=1 Tax=Anguilla anguilla TaxID=7936 RepID=A0A0E9QCP8_ANGAN
MRAATKINAQISKQSSCTSSKRCHEDGMLLVFR